MQLRDALFNWLQIAIVAEARPTDGAAQETRAFFEEILHDDHGLTAFSKEADETMYHIRYEIGGRSLKLMFDRESAEQLLADIHANPKYNE